MVDKSQVFPIEYHYFRFRWLNNSSVHQSSLLNYTSPHSTPSRPLQSSQTPTVNEHVAPAEHSRLGIDSPTHNHGDDHSCDDITSDVTTRVPSPSYSTLGSSVSQVGNQGGQPSHGQSSRHHNVRINALRGRRSHSGTRRPEKLQIVKPLEGLSFCC